MGQAMYVVFVIAIMDIVNIQAMHSTNLEQMIEAALVAIVLWLLLGSFLIYHAQTQMKIWYRLEQNAHNSTEFDKLYQQYDKIYKKFESVGEI